ncbi:hypothetical protein [uncultured Treponema sp.]|uniref:hypothetical protein n=1 Tax=uncultured Treponema sp. TaxID=162155 RepID=UPI0015BDA97D|nr:hypothetical protein [uncultured Treponema sp.]
MDFASSHLSFLRASLKIAISRDALNYIEKHGVMQKLQVKMDKGVEHRRRRRFAKQNDGARRRGSAEDPVFAQQKWPPT